MSYTKRISAPNTWQISRIRGGKYVATGEYKGATKKESIPLIILIKNLFPDLKTRKEITKKNFNFHIGLKKITRLSTRVNLFETISYTENDVLFKKILLINEKKKLYLAEYPKNQELVFISKIIGITNLKKNIFQYNLLNGLNFLKQKNNEKYSIGQTIILDSKKNILEHSAQEKEAYFINGTRCGKVKKIQDIAKNDKKIRFLYLTPIFKTFLYHEPTDR